MQHRRLGRAGALVSPLALGTDNILNPTPEDESSRMIIRALDGGINLIDTSNSYGAGEAERVIGRVLAESGRRDEVVIATKVHYPTGPGPNDRGNSRLHIMRACEQSLRRLQTDRIDLYQLHRPDFDVPMEETLGALTDLVRQGKVCYIGSSTAPAWTVLEGVLLAELKGLVPFVTDQPPYNLLDRRVENELVPMAVEVRPRSAAVVAAGDGRARRSLRRRQHPPRGVTRQRARRHLRRASQPASRRGRQQVRPPGA